MLDTTDCTTNDPCVRSKGKTIYCPWHYRDIFASADDIEWIKRVADQNRFLLEVKMNVMFTTWEHSLGLAPSHSLDLAKTTNKFRAMGAIK